MTNATSALPERLAALLALQDHDLHVDQLQHHRSHLESRQRLGLLTEQVQNLDRRGAVISKERSEHQVRLDELERHSDEARERIATIEKQAQNAGSFRDQEAMAQEIASLAKRQHELEDEELEVMALIEPLDMALEALREERGRLLADAQVTKADVERDELAIDAEIAAASGARAALVAEVSSDLVAEYERLRAHLGGIGAARVVHNSCSGCNLQLSATEIDQIRHASTNSLMHCEQCGRILVP